MKRGFRDVVVHRGCLPWQNATALARSLSFASRRMKGHDMVGKNEDHIERRGDVVEFPNKRAWKTWRLDIPSRDEVDVQQAMTILEDLVRDVRSYIDRYPRGPEDDIALMMHGLEMLTAKYRNKLAAMRKTRE